MKKMNVFWCEDTPTPDEIREAFYWVMNSNCAVMLCWSKKGQGDFTRIISPDTVSQYSNYKEYYNKNIPTYYGRMRG